MADYFTFASFVVPVGAGRAVDAATAYHRLFMVDDGLIEPLGVDAGEVYGLPQMEADGDNAVWLSHDESLDVEVTCRVVQWLQDGWGAPDRVEFEWADVCSKPRLDAFHGGAAVVRRDRVQIVGTGEVFELMDERPHLGEIS